MSGRETMDERPHGPTNPVMDRPLALDPLLDRRREPGFN